MPGDPSRVSPTSGWAVKSCLPPSQTRGMPTGPQEGRDSRPPDPPLQPRPRATPTKRQEDRDSRPPDPPLQPRPRTTPTKRQEGRDSRPPDPPPPARTGGYAHRASGGQGQ